MIIVYTEGNNHSCQQTIRWFENEKIPFKERKINRRHPITENELRWLLAQTDNGLKDIFKSKYLNNRQVKNEFNESKLSEIIDLIIINPWLLKDPIIADGRRLVVGYNENLIRCFVPKNKRQEWRRKNIDYSSFR
ncbi:hypothetical protein IGI39_001461 [Enterococcus sp. AZ135]|uniref:ArsC/Spx/MgsR family protein n=1 Tax=unclassified Enterococcus TaxID=2608891 RepID=UPI003F20F36A